MAIAWLSVLQAVPWSDVIANAPKVAEGAKKLWSTVAKKPVTSTTHEPAAASAGPASSQSRALEAAEARLTVLEANATQMHEQLVASSELIQALAEQNTQLIQRIEANRVRVVWLTWVAVIGAGAGLVGLLLAWARPLASA